MTPVPARLTPAVPGKTRRIRRTGGWLCGRPHVSGLPAGGCGQAWL